MLWRDSYERPEPILTSGEPREQIEVEARYELITPLGLRAVAGVLGSPAFRANRGLWNLDSEGLVGMALCDVYGFLGGDGVILLAKAAACLLEALALQDGAERVMHGHVEGSRGFECLPPAGMRAVALAAAGLAGTIGAYTRERVGYPAHVLVGEAIGGMFTWFVVREGSWDAASHLGRAALDLMDAIHAIEKWPEQQAATPRGPGGEPPSTIEGRGEVNCEVTKVVRLSPKLRVEEKTIGEWVIDGKMKVQWEPGEHINDAPMPPIDERGKDYNGA